MAYDILIQSGTVIDGSGKPPFAGDVAIEGEKISAIGNLGKKDAALVINAAGKYVTPGFVDVTNHSDTHLTIFKYPSLESLLMQGITTIIGGNCGASLAPLGRKEALGAVKKWADPSEININWATMGEYLSEVERMRPEVNYGTLVGYGTLRRGIIGDEARLFTTEEREEAKMLLKKSLEEGAFGLSLGLSYGHERVSNTEELIDIARVVGAAGGIIKIHLRSEGKEILASVNEAIRIGRESGVSIEISHLKVIGKKAWPYLQNVLEIIAHAKESGLNVSFDVSPYHTTGSSLYLLIPSWAREGGFRELFSKIADPVERKVLVETLKNHTLHYDKIFIVSAKLLGLAGKTVARVAEESGMSPEEALLEMLRVNEGRVTILGRTVSRKNTEIEIRDPHSIIATDGEGYTQDAARGGNLVHPRSFGAFPHFWHTFVDDLKAFSPETAIEKMASRAAQKFHIANRGELKAGTFADVLVFDPRLFRDRATYRIPFRYPAGIEWVIVNGKVSVSEGQFSGARAGKILKRS